MLVHTTSSIDHRILASTQRGRIDPQEKESPVAIGDMLDKCARAILPVDAIPKEVDSVIYGKLLENFVRHSKFNGLMHFAYKAPEKRQDEIEIYHSENGWILPPPLRLTRDMKYDFSGFGGMVRSIMQKKPDMPREERLELAYHTMRLAFEHLASRVIFALQDDEQLLANPPKHLVLSGGVASNLFLRRVLGDILKARGFGNIQIIAPQPSWCTDNAVMIAWTGAEMYESGWTTDDTFLPMGEWPIEQIITGADCWVRRDGFPPFEPGKNTNGQQEVTSTPGPPIATSEIAPESLASQEPAADQPLEDHATPETAPAESVASQEPATDQSIEDHATPETVPAESVASQEPAIDQPSEDHAAPETAPAESVASQEPAIDQPSEDHAAPETAPAESVALQEPAVDQAIEDHATPDGTEKPMSRGRRKQMKAEQQKAQVLEQKAKYAEAREAKQKAKREKAKMAKKIAEQEKAEKAKLKAEEREAEAAKQKAERTEARIAKQKAKEEKAEIAKQKAAERKAEIAKQKAEQREAEVARKEAKQKEVEVAKQKAEQKEVEVAKQKAEQKEAEVARQEAKQKETEVAKQKAEQKQAEVSVKESAQDIQQQAQRPPQTPISIRKIQVGSRDPPRLDHSPDRKGRRTPTRQRADKSGNDGAPHKQHIVRRLRPLQPPAEEAVPSDTAMGPFQKGLSALKRWAGL